MAENQDELNRRRKARRARQRARKRRQMLLRLTAAALVLVLAAVGMVLLFRNAPDQPVEPTTEPTQAPTEADTETTAPQTGPTEAEAVDTTVIHVAAAGDLMVTDKTVDSGLTEEGYDYSQVFMDVAPVLSGADLAVLNFEGNLLGVPYGDATTSAPQELAQAVKAMGVDLVQMANSTTITDGVASLRTSLTNLRRVGLEPLGAYADSQDFQKYKGYTIVEVQGIRIAFVAFTKGMGGLSLPAGSEDCVNLLYTDYATTYQEIDKAGINAILSNVEKESPDLTIALVHWGSEYKDMVTKSQNRIASLMKDGGVDVVLGTHPHMVHEIQYDEMTGQLVAYSLGDFFGDADRAGSDYSIILDLEITRDNTTGLTRVTDYSYTPICTLTEETSPDGQRRVVRLEQTLQSYQDRFVDRVSDDVYANLERYLTRIAERIDPPKEEEK